jgi:hypothetical protein
MSVPPPGQLAIILEAERIDPEVIGPYQYHTIRRIARITPPVDRM